MPSFNLFLEVFRKDGIADPRSSDELRKVKALFPEYNVTELRIAKTIGFVIEAASQEEAEATAHQLASDFLVQPVLEDYNIHFIQDAE